MQAEDYPMFDIEYVFLQIRSKSVGEVAKLKVLCPDDGKTYADVEVDLAKIEVYVDDDHSNNIVIDKDRNLGVTMKYPTLKDIDGDTLTGDVNIEKTYKMIENSIESIYEGEVVHMSKDIDKKELTEFLDNLTADQMKKLTAFYNSMPRLEHKVKVKNPKTEVESEVTLKGLASFFA
jgi:hypothetical protein